MTVADEITEQPAMTWRRAHKHSRPPKQQHHFALDARKVCSSPYVIDLEALIVLSLAQSLGLQMPALLNCFWTCCRMSSQGCTCLGVFIKDSMEVELWTGIFVDWCFWRLQDSPEISM